MTATAEEAEKRPKAEDDTMCNSKKRKSRWGDESDKVCVNLSMLASAIQQEAVKARERIHEINRLLMTPGFGIPVDPIERSPSPEPIYDNRGIRINTREFRTRKRLEEERQTLIQRTMLTDPTFQPPPGFKAETTMIEDRIDIPQNTYPHINFIGLLIGPRGNTLKDMEKSSGAKIMIRGKGSVKPGKGRLGGQPTPGEDEELHALVRAPDEVSFKKATERIHKIIRMAIDCPVEQNQLKKQQLELLAKMNGTFREESLFEGCRNCGSTEHRDWECMERKNAVTAIVCGICGGAGHIDSDCVQKNKEGIATVDKAKMDKEFALFLKDLGEEAVPDDLKNAETGGDGLQRPGMPFGYGMPYPQQFAGRFRPPSPGFFPMRMPMPMMRPMMHPHYGYPMHPSQMWCPPNGWGVSAPVSARPHQPAVNEQSECIDPSRPPPPSTEPPPPPPQS